MLDETALAQGLTGRFLYCDWQREILSPVLFLLVLRRARWMSLPSSMLVLPCLPLPLLHQLNKENCSLLAHMLCLRVRVSVYHYTDAGVADIGTANVCVFEQARGVGNNLEDRVRPCARYVSV